MKHGNLLPPNVEIDRFPRYSLCRPSPQSLGLMSRLLHPTCWPVQLATQVCKSPPQPHPLPSSTYQPDGNDTIFHSASQSGFRPKIHDLVRDGFRIPRRLCLLSLRYSWKPTGTRRRSRGCLSNRNLPSFLGISKSKPRTVEEFEKTCGENRHRIYLDTNDDS